MRICVGWGADWNYNPAWWGQMRNRLGYQVLKIKKAGGVNRAIDIVEQVVSTVYREACVGSETVIRLTY